MAEASTVQQLQPGDHACLTFTDSEERLDLVAAFVREGLRGGRRVLCVTDSIEQAALSGQLAERGLPVADATAAGQMSVLPGEDLFVADGTFAAARTLRIIEEQAGRALRDGFTGLWVTSDMCWALRPVAGVDQLMDYEAQVTGLLVQGRAAAVCQYDRQCFDAVTLAGANAHHGLALSATTYHHDALLRICRQYQPTGVRVAGEIDYRYVEPLTRALSEAVALDDHVHVNLVALEFIDGSAAGTIMQAAATLGPEQHMTVRCRDHVGKVLHALNCHTLPRVAVVVIDDD